MDFNEHCGYRQLGMRDSRYEIELEVQKLHLNRFGFVHGGLLFTMLDTAMSHAVYASLPLEEAEGVTLEMKINYLKKARLGDLLTASGIVVHRTRRTAFAEGVILNQDGALVAKSTATMLSTVQ